MSLKIGDEAPNFVLQNQDGIYLSLKDFRGKWVVLYFYPKDATPGCTVEGIEFTKEKKAFENHHAIIFGVSPDTPANHCKFIEKEKLGIPLLCDPDKSTLKTYSAWGKRSLYGKLFRGVLRTTFLIAPTGNIAWIWKKVTPKGHAQNVLKKLEELQKK